MTDVSSEVQAVTNAAEKRGVDAGYLLEILGVQADRDLTRAKKRDRILAIIRKEADRRLADDHQEG
jgi:hypothetical protein